VDPLTANRHIAFAVVTAAQVFIIYRLWILPHRERRVMLLVYMVTAFAQSSTSTWLAAGRPDPYQAFTTPQEIAAYFTFGMKVLGWPFGFGAIHECLNAYLTPYRALHSVGQRLLRGGMGFAGLAVLASALIAPRELFAAMSFLSRTEPILIYGCATLLCLGVVAFVWHFQLKGSANDDVTLLMMSLIYGQFAILWAGQHFFQPPRTAGHWAVLRVIVAAPILIGAGLRLSAAGDTRPVSSMPPSQPDIRQALENLNATLGREGVRS
jgi:hypothetical protein